MTIRKMTMMLPQPSAETWQRDLAPTIALSVTPSSSASTSFTSVSVPLVADPHDAAHGVRLSVQLLGLLSGPSLLKGGELDDAEFVYI
jgi:hypothetical protein